MGGPYKRIEHKRISVKDNWAQVKQGIRCKKCRQVTTLRDDGFCSAECLEKYCLGVDTHKEKVKNDIKQRRKCWTCREDNQLLNDDTIQQQLATAIQQIHATTTLGGNDNATLDEGVMESEHDLMSDDDDNNPANVPGLCFVCGEVSQDGNCACTARSRQVPAPVSLRQGANFLRVLANHSKRGPQDSTPAVLTILRRMTKDCTTLEGPRDDISGLRTQLRNFAVDDPQAGLAFSLQRWFPTHPNSCQMAYTDPQQVLAPVTRFSQMFAGSLNRVEFGQFIDVIHAASDSNLR
ncbi:hypothetical protein BGX23_002619, partial [Mortierella sp. AD031]